ncbi:ABC transporter permease [Agromyces seonyuensis]|uniref:Polyketide antibiotic transporter n=1 Tax=Agromyces seonyuensis TaxID=2662446 RepID=A0A6I4P3W4_9MICO|nr:polyketide antibiotic transporter [Agromyces seonyuensis]MWB98057.1 polyketide antibiotic transporter [Agromyces seonyuensis]
MNGFGALLRQRLRRDRWTLLWWILGTTALAAIVPGAIGSSYGTEAERAGLLQLTAQAPAILIFRGTPNGADEGAFSFFLIFAFLGLMAGLMNTFLAVRHTRAEEEEGRAEQVAATPAGRITPTIATVAHGVLADVVLALLVAAAFAGGGLPVSGALVTGAATAAVGIAFLGFGLVAAQLFRTSRAANALSVAAVLAAYVVRGIGDATGERSADGLHVTPGWASWLSPIGWAQLANAWNGDDWVALLLPLGFGLLLVLAVLGLQRVRDLGASLLPGRRGRASAGPVLASTLGLAWKLDVGVIVAWAVGGLFTGLLATSLTPLVDAIATDAPQVGDTLQGIAGADGTIEQALLTTFFTIGGLLAACCAAQIVIKARQEEARGTAELVLATPVGRVRWLAAFLAVAAIGAVLALAATFLGAVLGTASIDDPSQALRDSALAALGQVPAALVFVAIPALCFVLARQATIPLTWALLGLSGFLGVFGELLGLPDWTHDLSPFAHAPTPQGDDYDWSGGWWLLGVAAVGIAAALVLMRRRQVAGDG